jgi:hypothetical protein
VDLASRVSVPRDSLRVLVVSETLMSTSAGAIMKEWKKAGHMRGKA